MRKEYEKNGGKFNLKGGDRSAASGKRKSESKSSSKS